MNQAHVILASSSEPMAHIGELSTFPSVLAFFRHYRMPIPKSGEWRLAEPKLGEIVGVPNSRGKLIATNGIECFIVREDDSLFRGHLDWFKADKQEKQLSRKPRLVNVEKESTLDWLWQELSA